ncbi:hypothetical protein HJC23_004976 [Cyclotella cryptica]|uniref:Uncharacterized protein n=1 Tax=Cyclotella cryptica TaxID=29204 RepID=A0ABD3P9B3_9STRA
MIEISMIQFHLRHQNQVDKDHPDHAHIVLKNRVPEVTVVFWIIKVLSTTTGESFSDWLATSIGQHYGPVESDDAAGDDAAAGDDKRRLEGTDDDAAISENAWQPGLGLPNTTYIMLAVFVVGLAAQFYTKRYNAFVYWFLVVVVSVVGTCITDNIHDGLGVPNWIMSIVWFVILVTVFGAWYYKERTLSFHSIFTRRREAFYWCAILITFALGTAFGDLITEGFGLGYGKGVALFGGIILAVFLVWNFSQVNGVLCFWITYILTRPLGASLGDLLAGPKDEGGLGIGYEITRKALESMMTESEMQTAEKAVAIEHQSTRASTDHV